MRDYEREHQDTAERKYAYDFDHILRRFMMRSFGPLLPQGKALELGCYQGEFTQLIAGQYADLTVIEAAAELLEFTRNRVGPGVRFINSTFEAAELAEKYDAIFLVHTLEHLDDPAAVLNKINSWLSDRGRLFLAVPNANAPSRQIAVKMGLIPYNSAVTAGEAQHGHRKTYTFDTLERDALDGGLSIVSRGGVFFKALANYQFDRLFGTDIISQDYLEGCYQLGMQYPDLCASIYLVCAKGG